MELDELKNIWKNQDSKLDQVLKTNELLLKKINYDKARQDFKSTLNMERLNIWTIPLILIWSFISCIINNWENYLLINFIIIILLGVLSLYFYPMRLKKLKGLLKFDNNISESAKKLIQYEEFINRNKKYEYLLLPFLGFSFFYIFTYNLHAFQNETVFLVTLISTISITLLLMPFLYKKYFTKKIDATREYIKELEEFES